MQSVVRTSRSINPQDSPTTNKRSITLVPTPAVLEILLLEKPSTKRAPLHDAVPSRLPEHKLLVLVRSQLQPSSALLCIVLGGQEICLLEPLAPFAHEVGNSHKGWLVPGALGLAAMDEDYAAELPGGKDGRLVGHGHDALSAKDIVVGFTESNGGLLLRQCLVLGWESAEMLVDEVADVFQLQQEIEVQTRLVGLEIDAEEIANGFI